MIRLSFPGGYCQSVIVFEYYDGPMIGIGSLKDGSYVYFQVVAWDDEQWVRLYATMIVPIALADIVKNAFSIIESPREPVWCPSHDGNHKAQSEIEKAISEIYSFVQTGIDWRLVESHNLTDSSVLTTLNDSDVRKIKRCVDSRKVFDLRSGDLLEEFMEIMTTYGEAKEDRDTHNQKKDRDGKDRREDRDDEDGDTHK